MAHLALPSLTEEGIPEVVEEISTFHCLEVPMKGVEGEGVHLVPCSWMAYPTLEEGEDPEVEDRIHCREEVALGASAALAAYYHAEEAFQDDVSLVEVAALVAFLVDQVVEEEVNHGAFRS